MPEVAVNCMRTVAQRRKNQHRAIGPRRDAGRLSLGLALGRCRWRQAERVVTKLRRCGFKAEQCWGGGNNRPACAYVCAGIHAMNIIAARFLQRGVNPSTPNRAAFAF